MTFMLVTAFAIPSLTAQNRQTDPPTSKTPNKTKVVVKEKQGKRHWYQIGKASWYGPHFQGKETASGESFDQNDLTAAHRTLPLGSVVRVTNLSNGNQVTVRINDRGPVYHSRIIDLSSMAARILGFRSQGLQTVRLDVISEPVQMAGTSADVQAFH